MKRFLIDDSSFSSRVGKLSGAQSADDVEVAFARSVLSMITEPGDRFAGALLQSLGPCEFLELEIQKSSSAEVSQRLIDRGELDEIEHVFGKFQVALAEARQRWSARLKLSDADVALDLALRVNAKLLTPENETWPAQLDDLNYAKPHCLWVRTQLGNDVFLGNSISIVGSRVCTSYGEWVTSEIVADAANRNLNVVSGGAYGIDAIAHRSSLAIGQPTLAFMAGGIDRIYPSGNATLLEKVVSQGALVAEQAPGASPTKWRFLQRNRLIAALGQATVVVEAGLRSGALNTVTHATELGRPIGAVPGPITSQSSAGCNHLLSQGVATSICSPSEAADLALGKQGWFQPELDGLGAFETRALDAMSGRALSQQEVASRAGLTTKEVAIALGQLVLLGFVEQRDKGWVKLPLERE